MPPKNVIVACVLGLAACGDPLFFLHEERLVTETQGDQLISQTCEQLSGGAGESSGSGFAGPMGGGPIPSFQVETQLFDEGARVVVLGPSGARIANKIYSDEFLESGRRDDFKLRLDATTELRLVFWGDTHCEFPDQL